MEGCQLLTSSNLLAMRMKSAEVKSSKIATTLFMEQGSKDNYKHMHVVSEEARRECWILFN